MKGGHTYFYSNLLLMLLLVIFISCRKDKVQEPIIEEPTKWELISGDYKVYDTLGNYLYDMEIEHKVGFYENGNQIDSLIYTNFDDLFNFSQKQNSDDLEDPIKMGSHNPIKDYSNNRWHLFGVLSKPEFNNFNNDTIILKFNKTNILYYLQDLVPYYECDCKQIAVKQH